MSDKGLSSIPPKCLLDDPTIDMSTRCVLKRFLMPSGDVIEIVG